MEEIFVWSGTKIFLFNFFVKMIEHLIDFIPQFEMQIKLSKYIKSLYTKANIDSYFVNSRHPKNNFKQNLQKVGNTGPLF